VPGAAHRTWGFYMRDVGRCTEVKRGTWEGMQMWGAVLAPKGICLSSASIGVACRVPLFDPGLICSCMGTLCGPGGSYIFMLDACSVYLEL